MTPYAVAVASNVVYIGSWEFDFLSTVEIVDFSDPGAPALRGYYSTPGYPMDIALSGSRAFVADAEGGLLILDVSDPGSPRRLGGFDTKGSVSQVEVSGQHVYISDGPWLTILDVGDLANPRWVGLYKAADVIQPLKVSGSKVYLTLITGELTILDVGAPAQIRLLASFRCLGMQSLAVSGALVCLAGYSGLQVLDDAGNPSKILWLARDWSTPAQDVALIGNYALVAAGQTGLVIEELRRTLHPALRQPLPEGDSVALAWPSIEGARLQVSSTLTPATWRDVPNSESTNIVRVRRAVDGAFFRLRVEPK